MTAPTQSVGGEKIDTAAEDGQLGIAEGCAESIGVVTVICRLPINRNLECWRERERQRPLRAAVLSLDNDSQPKGIAGDYRQLAGTGQRGDRV